MVRNNVTFTVPDSTGMRHQQTTVLQRRTGLTIQGAERILRRKYHEKAIVLRVEPMLEA